MFDVMLNVVAINTEAPNEEQVAAGSTPEVIVSLVSGLMLPLADPSNPSQPVTVPGGQVRFRLDGEGAIDFGEKLIEQGQRMPKRSRIEVATSVSAAEDAARRLHELRG